MGRPLGMKEPPEHSPAFARALRRRMGEVQQFGRQKLKWAGEALRKRHGSILPVGRQGLVA